MNIDTTKVEMVHMQEFYALHIIVGAMKDESDEAIIVSRDAYGRNRKSMPLSSRIKRRTVSQR